MKGVCSEMRSKSSMVSGILSSCAMAMRWRTALVLPPDAATAAMAFSMDLRVRMSEGLTPRRARSMTMRPAARRGFVLFGRHGGDAGDHHGRDAEELAGHGHGVGGELASAGAGAGTGGGFESFELVVVDLAGGVRAHAFEDLEDGDLFVGAVGLLEVAGGDAAAVEHEAGDVEAGERHDAGGHVLVAAGDADEAVEAVAAGDEFDAVGDDFAADERGLHALRAHGDAVVDGDGVELHGHAAGLADALLDGFGDLAEMEVAGADLGPGVGDADEGLVQVFLAEADGAEVAAGGGAVGAFG